MDLHGGAVDQHPPVPAEPRLLLEEHRVHAGAAVRAPPLVLLGERDGEGEVGRAEADPDHVVDTGLHALLLHQADFTLPAASAIFGTTLSTTYGTASGVGVRSGQNAFRSSGT